MTQLVSRGFVDNGYALVALGEERAEFTLDGFRTNFEDDDPISMSVHPSYAVGGTVVLGTDMIPLALSGEIYVDTDTQHRLRGVGGNTALALSLSAYGISREISLAEASFFIDPAQCGTGQYLTHVGRASESIFEGSGLENLGLETGGYSVDTYVCGEDVLVQFRAAGASIAGFQLGDVRVGFTPSGVALQAKLHLAGVQFDMVGSIDPVSKQVHLTSVGGISLYGHDLAAGGIDVKINGAQATVRVEGDLEVSGIRFHLNQRVTTPDPTLRDADALPSRRAATGHGGLHHLALVDGERPGQHRAGRPGPGGGVELPPRRHRHRDGPHRAGATSAGTRTSEPTAAKNLSGRLSLYTNPRTQTHYVDFNVPNPHVRAPGASTAAAAVHHGPAGLPHRAGHGIQRVRRRLPGARGRVSGGRREPRRAPAPERDGRGRDRDAALGRAPQRTAHLRRRVLGDDRRHAARARRRAPQRTDQARGPTHEQRVDQPRGDRVPGRAARE